MSLPDGHVTTRCAKCGREYIGAPEHARHWFEIHVCRMRKRGTPRDTSAARAARVNPGVCADPEAEALRRERISATKRGQPKPQHPISRQGRENMRHAALARWARVRAERAEA